jgi:hypothetical protein
MELGRMPFSGLFDKSKAIRYAKFDKEEKRLNFGVEDLRVKLFSDRVSYSRSLKLPSDLEIKPQNQL